MINTVYTIIKLIELLDMRSVGTGINRTISISNTMKIIANKKNRIENGIRAVLFGSNPHSKGDNFSRSSVLRAAKIKAAISTIVGIKKVIENKVAARFIN